MNAVLCKPIRNRCGIGWRVAFERNQVAGFVGAGQAFQITQYLRNDQGFVNTTRGNIQHARILYGVL